MIRSDRLAQRLGGPVLFGVAKEQDELIWRKGTEVANGKHGREALAEGAKLVRDAAREGVIDDQPNILFDVAFVDGDVPAVSFELDGRVARQGEVEREVIERSAIDVELGDLFVPLLIGLLMVSMAL